MNQALAKARKKVLFLITKATHGGAQKYVFDLATHLPAEKFEVAVAYGKGGRLLEMLKEKNIQTHQIPALGRDIAIASDIASFFQILKFLRRARSDVVHVNSSKAAALGALAARLAGVRRIIFTAHGWPFKENRNPLTRALIYFVSWFTALCSHATIVVSKTDETIGKRMLFVGKKIRYVPLGIAAPAFLPREEARRAVGRMDDVANADLPRIVSIAELTHNKGIRYAIDAIAALKDRNVPCTYFIIGDGELREELEEYAIQKEVETRVVFCGFVENAPQLLKAFDVFLLPSLKEGTPYVLLEAAAAGLPIVATDVIDRSFADSGSSVLVPPANANMLAVALERAIGMSTHIGTPIIPSLEKMIEQTSALYY